MVALLSGPWALTVASTGKCPFIMLPMEARPVAAPVATVAMRVTPISKADAVVAVRRGLRWVFSIASSPGIPPRRATPMARPRLPMRTGANTSTPAKLMNPPATPHITAFFVSISLVAQMMTRAVPARKSSVPNPTRTRPTLRVGVSVTGWRATTGATLVARRAGGRAARVVTTTPTRIGMMQDVTVTLTEVSIGDPAALRPISMSWVTPIPRAVPTTDPMRPAMSASPRTERRTCFRVAPMQRARARVRVRCATRIVKVLTMTIAATARAITAKAPMKVVMAANPWEA